MTEEPRDEYRFDYAQAKKNRFAEALSSGGRVVYLEPEVATAFPDSESVNRQLRAVLTSIPASPPRDENVSG